MTRKFEVHPGTLERRVDSPARWNGAASGPFVRSEGEFVMTRLYLAAGVAALAIAVPATAGPGGHGGGGGQRPERAQTVQQRGGGAARVQRTKTAQAPRPQRA